MISFREFILSGSDLPFVSKPVSRDSLKKLKAEVTPSIPISIDNETYLVYKRYINKIDNKFALCDNLIERAFYDPTGDKSEETMATLEEIANFKELSEYILKNPEMLDDIRVAKMNLLKIKKYFI